MQQMNLPQIQVPQDRQSAFGIYRTRLQSGLRTPSALSELLLAYMAWPREESGRNRWMAACNATRLAHGKKLAASPSVDPFGGLASVASEALAATVGLLTGRMKSWEPTADVLQMLVDTSDPTLKLRGGPSISKAIELCADDRSGGSQSQIRRCWGDFREVAHLLAAGAVLAKQVPEGGGSIFSAAWHAPDSLLAIASGFQMFGLDLKPHGQLEGALPSSLWRIPPHCIPDAPWIERRALSGRQKAILSGYKALKKYGKE